MIRALTLSKRFPKQLVKLLYNWRITLDEFLTYAKTNPRTFMVFKPSHSDIYEYSGGPDFKYSSNVSVYTLNYTENWAITLSIVSTKYDYDKITEVNFIPITDGSTICINEICFEYVTKTTKFLDLLSTYRIVNKRKPCIDDNPSYAKKFVKHQFKEIIDNYEILIKKNLLYYFDLYLYLAGHTWIFNLDIPLFYEEIVIKVNKERQSISEIDKLDQIKTIIIQLIQEINKRLEIIDLLA